MLEGPGESSVVYRSVYWNRNLGVSLVGGVSRGRRARAWKGKSKDSSFKKVGGIPVRQNAFREETGGTVSQRGYECVSGSRPCPVGCAERKTNRKKTRSFAERKVLTGSE